MNEQFYDFLQHILVCWCGKHFLFNCDGNCFTAYLQKKHHFLPFSSSKNGARSLALWPFQFPAGPDLAGRLVLCGPKWGDWAGVSRALRIDQQDDGVLGVLWDWGVSKTSTKFLGEAGVQGCPLFASDSELSQGLSESCWSLEGSGDRLNVTCLGVDGRIGVTELNGMSISSVGPVAIVGAVDDSIGVERLGPVMLAGWDMVVTTWELFFGQDDQVLPGNWSTVTRSAMHESHEVTHEWKGNWESSVMCHYRKTLLQFLWAFLAVLASLMWTWLEFWTSGLSYCGGGILQHYWGFSALIYL